MRTNHTLAPTLAAMILALASATPLSADDQSTLDMPYEKLDRGLIAVPVSGGTFLSWRMLASDAEDLTRFDILRDGQVVAENVYKTNYVDKKGTASSTYQIRVKVGGQEAEATTAAGRWANNFLTIPLDRPAKGALGGTYTPNDCAVGDVDGDGQYELLLKWDPSNSHDNSQSGKTDNVIVDCYRLDGTKLWRIDLGPNIRAGAHYTQLMVYDFDGDGRAELVCKTAPGTIDGTGAYANQAATDATILSHNNASRYANSDGHVIDGPEYLTVFEGTTGRALHTTWYLPGRAGTGGKLTTTGGAATEGGSELGKVSAFPKGFWGDNYGNRSERYLAAVAYVNGNNQPPCAIFCRGYYTQAYVWAVSFDGTRLHSEWLHASPSTTQSVVFAKYRGEDTKLPVITIDGDQLVRTGLKTAPKNTAGLSAADSEGGIAGSNTLYGNGNHNLSVADVDGDGCDEIVWGSAALNNDGTLLYATGYGHGDAIHLADLLPDRPGLEVYQIHEEKLLGGKGSWDLHDAATGEIIYKEGSDKVDNGRGMAADISAAYRGQEFWSYDDRTPRRADNGKPTSLSSQSANFRLYWNGDLQDELLDGHYAKNSSDEFDHVDHIYITAGDANRIVDWTNRSTCNTTKMTPCLTADILGDWREEVVLWDYQNPTELYIHTTTIETGYRMPTLMHDHTYRMGVCWQNTAYNQPPHLGYYLPDALAPRIANPSAPIVTQNEQVELRWKWRYAKSATVASSYKPDGTKKAYAAPEGMTYSIDANEGYSILKGALSEVGDYRIDLKLTGYGNETATETLTIRVVDPSGISDVSANGTSATTAIYDLSGRRQQQARPGVSIIRQGGKTRKLLTK